MIEDIVIFDRLPRDFRGRIKSRDIERHDRGLTKGTIKSPRAMRA